MSLVNSSIIFLAWPLSSACSAEFSLDTVVHCYSHQTSKHGLYFLLIRVAVHDLHHRAYLFWIVWYLFGRFFFIKYFSTES